MRHYIALTIAVTLFTVPWLAVNFPDQADYILAGMKNVGSQLAAVITHNPRTIAQLQEKYNNESPTSNSKVRIVIVPGHEPNYGGAEFGDLKERDLTVSLADDLARFLRENGKYDVIVARTADAWNPTFADYFKNSWNSIIDWQKAHKDESLRILSSGPPQAPPKVYHNSAPNDVAYRLYGITKWSNENNVDIIIHIHLNDYPGHAWKVPGKYSGFSIYTPETQYANGTTTYAISEAVFKRLKKYNPVSDFPGESDGIVEERELIAVGASNTADAASMLLEYGYLYEPQFTNPDTRKLALEDLAFQTYIGLEDFFNPNGSKSLAALYDTLVLPHNWKWVLSENSKANEDIYALQTALLVDGVYPPTDKSKNDCPRTGKIGPCTISAVKAFQKKYNINENGIGEKTVRKLNNLYSIQPM